MQDNWQILGHKKIIDFLQTSLVKNKLAGAYLFHGPANVGKLTLAQKFATEIVGPSRSLTSIHILQRLPEKKEISIDQIRDWQRMLQMTSFDQGPSVGLIAEAEHLSLEAANALLKTIEEPKAKTVIILITSKRSELLTTIVSRCQTIRFSEVSNDVLSQYLQENNHPNIEQLLRQVVGRPGSLLKLLTESELIDQEIKQDQEIEELVKKDSAQRLNWLEKYFASVDSLVEKNYLARVLLKKLARLFKPSKINYHWFEKLLQAEANLKTNVQPKIVLENLLLDL